MAAIHKPPKVSKKSSGKFSSTEGKKPGKEMAIEMAKLKSTKEFYGTNTDIGCTLEGCLGRSGHRASINHNRRIPPLQNN